MQSRNNREDLALQAIRLAYRIEIDTVDTTDNIAKKSQPEELCDQLRLVPHADGSVSLCILFEMNSKLAKRQANGLDKLFSNIQADLKKANLDHQIRIAMLYDLFSLENKKSRLWDYRLHLPADFVNTLIKNRKKDQRELLQFTLAYEIAYRNCLFSNPHSEMKVALSRGTVQTMQQVKNYAAKKPDSRSAEVLAKLEEETRNAVSSKL